MPSFLASDCSRGAERKLVLEDVFGTFPVDRQWRRRAFNRRLPREAAGHSKLQWFAILRTAMNRQKRSQSAFPGGWLVRKSDGDPFRWRLASLRTTPETRPAQCPTDRAFSRATSLRWPNPGPKTGGRGHFRRIGRSSARNPPRGPPDGGLHDTGRCCRQNGNDEDRRVPL